METKQHGATEPECPNYIRLPNRRSLHLFEAITALAFGYVLDQDDREVRLQQLRDHFLKQARPDGPFAQFATEFADAWPLEIWRDKLEDCRSAWTAPAVQLHRLISEQIAITAYRYAARPKLQATDADEANLKTAVKDGTTDISGCGPRQNRALDPSPACRLRPPKRQRKSQDFGPAPVTCR